ncbi:hypothetical protein GMLC_17990 [Geomonas limicola]|uniref:NERD domain-containing protein n=1 Tax=Geomonas limicola TaxID=2740186 RepID=A0A6V8N798_9BACT|nr:nuclease-related domain-containing protein [Geomonas limicola]GFO68220.1 hypothetical protein GMLC_17990 [Geomonas limicola]
MIIKKADNRDTDVLELKRLLECQLSAKQRFLIEREIKCIGSGIRGEESSAYYINFRYHDSQNWAIIHDLRLEHNGFAAQIDHVLINRCLDIYVLESKNYYYGIKISPEGEFSVWNGKAYVGIESPIEQNKRHISLLDKAIVQRGLLPTRLGLTMPAAYHNYVLVAPNSRIDRPSAAKTDFSSVIKADALVDAIGKRVDAMGVVGTLATAAKMVSSETLESFARSLIRLHRPSKYKYAEKFGVTLPEAKTEVTKEPAPSRGGNDVNIVTCETCGTEVESKVVNFCKMNKAKFAGKTLCQICQRKPLPVEQSEIIELTDSLASEEAGTRTCNNCGAPVDRKVAYFCRINNKRFKGEILCRSCQTTQIR